MNKEEALKEAERCLNCKNASCVKGCPVGIDIPNYINAILEERLEDAYDIITAKNILPEVTCRVCFHHEQCYGHCILNKKNAPIKIYELEQYVAENAPKEVRIGREGRLKKVAIIGSGPSGIACALSLCKANVEVTIFEREGYIGGVLSYGIPDYRLSNQIVKEVEKRLALGNIHIRLNTNIGTDLTLQDLKKEFDYVYIATGANRPNYFRIEGEETFKTQMMDPYEFIYSYAFLKDVNEGKGVQLGDKVIVVGGGNVAMDVARCARRLTGKSVEVFYRRTREKMPARIDEIEYAESEGVNIRFLTNPLSIRREGNEIILTKVNTELVVQDGVEKVVELEKTKEEIKITNLILAVGMRPDHEGFTKGENAIQLNKRGEILVNEFLKVDEYEKIYAGGDVVTGSLTVINAIGMGMKAAREILER